VIVVFVVADLVQNINQDEQAAGRAHRKAKQVDEGYELVPAKISQGDL
jgi:hypothetical protein